MARTAAWQAAVAAADRVDAPGKVHVVDSKNASTGEGMLAVLAAECAEAGLGLEQTRAIIDKQVRIPAGIEIGYDRELDRLRGFTITENNITVIAKTDGVEHFLKETGATGRAS